MRKPYLYILILLFLSSCGQNLMLEQADSGRSPAVDSEAQQEQTTDQIPENCPMQYDPVCGQPPMPECPEGRLCTQVMPNPKTYSNDCEMNKDGADKIRDGECPDTTF